MLEPVWVTRISLLKLVHFQPLGEIFGYIWDIFWDSLICYCEIQFEITSNSWWIGEKPFRRSGNLSCMIPSAEFEKTANCCKTTILKTVHSHHSGKRKSKCKLQIAAKQNEKCLLVTIWRKKTNYKLPQKNDHIHHSEKRKSILQIAAKNCSITPLGKRKSKLHKIG